MEPDVRTGDGGIAREPFFLKQYGARRTGTNLLRLLITASVRDTVVLMHVLGDKHSPPVDLAAAWGASARSEHPEIEFARQATLAARAETTDLRRPEQAAHLAAIASPLASAYRQGRLGFLISVKDPYTWAVSIGRYRGWLPSGPYNFAADRKAAGLLRAECEHLNHCCRAWLDHHRKFEPASMIVRFEDLVRRPAEIVASVCGKFGLLPTPVEVAAPKSIVIPASWDDAEVRLHRAPIDRTLSAESCLTPRLRDVVAASVDWAVWAQLIAKPSSPPISPAGTAANNPARPPSSPCPTY